MKGGQREAETLHQVMKSIGIRAELRPDSESEKWRVTAHEVCSKLLIEKTEDVIAYSKTHSYDLLRIEAIDGSFDFSEAPLEHLRVFLANPRYICFPPTATLHDGLMLSLENSLQLTESVDVLFASKSARPYLGLMSFLLLSSVEEIGKACMIVAAAREAARKRWKTAVIRGLKDHATKFHIAGKQLKPVAMESHLDSLVLFLHMLGMTREGMKDGQFGEDHREYGLYVGYEPHTKRWRTFRLQYESTLASDFREGNTESWTCLLKIACNALREEAQGKPVHEMRDLKEMFERSF